MKLINRKKIPGYELMKWQDVRITHKSETAPSMVFGNLYIYGDGKGSFVSAAEQVYGVYGSVFVDKSAVTSLSNLDFVLGDIVIDGEVRDMGKIYSIPGTLDVYGKLIYANSLNSIGKSFIVGGEVVHLCNLRTIGEDCIITGDVSHVPSCNSILGKTRVSGNVHNSPYIRDYYKQKEFLRIQEEKYR